MSLVFFPCDDVARSLSDPSSSNIDEFEQVFVEEFYDDESSVGEDNEVEILEVVGADHHNDVRDDTALFHDDDDEDDLDEDEDDVDEEDDEFFGLDEQLMQQQAILLEYAAARQQAVKQQQAAQEELDQQAQQQQHKDDGEDEEKISPLPAAAPESSAPLDQPQVPKKKTLDPNASAFVFNPSAAVFTPSAAVTAAAVAGKTVYPPWFLLQFQPTCLECPVPLPHEIDISFDYEYIFGFCPPLGLRGYDDGVFAADYQYEQDPQYDFQPKEADPNRIRYDRSFLLSIKDQHTARPECLCESEVDLEEAATPSTVASTSSNSITVAPTPVAPLETATASSPNKKKKKKGSNKTIDVCCSNDEDEITVSVSMTTTSAADAAIGRNTPKTPKSAKKKKKLAAAAAAAAAAVAASSDSALAACSSTSSLSTPVIARSTSTGRSLFQTPGSSSSAQDSINRHRSEPTPLLSSGRWRPALALTEDAVATKAARSILNKLTPEKFEKLAAQMAEITISSYETLVAVVDVLVEKTVSESAFVSMYCDLVVFLNSNMKLSGDLDFFSVLQEKSFGYFVSTQRSEAMPLESALSEMASDEDRDIAVSKAKKRWMGHVILLAELYKRALVNDDELDAVWCRLCSEISSDSAADDDAEALCTFLTHAGECLERLREDLACEFFEQLDAISNSESKFSSRIRFMAENLLALRKAKWVPRREAVVNPQKLSQIHALFSPSSTSSSARPSPASSSSSSHHFNKTPQSSFSSPHSASSSKSRTPSFTKASPSPINTSSHHYNSGSKSSPAQPKSTPVSARASPASYSSIVSNSNSARSGSKQAWDRNSWEAEMAAARKARLAKGGAPGTPIPSSSAGSTTPSSSSSSAPRRTNPTISAAHLLLDNSAAKDNKEGNADRAWDRVSWEEQMAKERKRRVEKEKSDRDTRTPNWKGHFGGQTRKVHSSQRAQPAAPIPAGSKRL